jgi:hypothetical protein
MLASADRYPMTASNDDNVFVRIERPRAGWLPMLGLATAVAMVLPLLGGLFLVTTQALSEPETLTIALAHPMVTLQIVVGLLLLSALVLVPVRRLFARVGRASLIEIDDNVVHVRESGLLRTRVFSEPLDSYLGVSPRIRTTLSGIRHELVLVHADAGRDVVIVLDGSEQAGMLARVTQHLELPEIAVGDIRQVRSAARLYATTHGLGGRDLAAA